MLKRAICCLIGHAWFMRFHYKGSELQHRKCKRCKKLQRHAGLNFWVTLEKG